MAAGLLVVFASAVRMVWAGAGATWKKIGLVLLLTAITVGLITDVLCHPESFDPSRWGGPIGLN